MATKRCPYCAEEIQAEALKCKHCGTWLSAAAVPGPNWLVRPSSNRMLAGVCAGIGNALRIDPTLVRILFALATFFTALVPGIIVYIILAFVIPTE
jgi:phage shock protein PspC (stress-responsive transcriptional regulator)